MARQVVAHYGVDQRRIEFLTMFSEVAEEIMQEGFAVHYLPPLLKRRKYDDRGLLICARLEQQIAANGGVPFSTMLNAERFAPVQGDAKLDFLYRHILVLDELIQEHSHFVCHDPEHMVYWIAFELVIAKDGVPIFYRRTSIPQGHVVPCRRTPSEIWPVKGAVAQEYQPNSFAEWKQGFLKTNSLPKSQLSTAQPPLTKRLKRRYSMSRHHLVDYLNASCFAELKALLPASAFNLFKGHRRRSFQKYRKVGDVRDFGRKKIYVPLHAEPEGAVLIQSHKFTNQLDFIRLLSSSTSVDMTIYVKESPYMIGLRKPEYYLALHAIPKVRFLDPGLFSNQIIPYVDMVATLCGTAALEGLLMGKAALIFGGTVWAPFFSDLPTFSQGADLKTLAEKIDKILSARVDVELIEACYESWIRQLIPCQFDLELHPERHDIQRTESRELLLDTLERIH